MTPSELIMPSPFLKLKLCVEFPGSLCPLSYFCIMSLYVVSDLYEVLIFHMIAKILQSPPHSLLLVSPFLAIYKISTLFSKWMKECNKKLSKFGILPYFYIYLPLMYISPPFWHWCQRVLRSNTIFSQKKYYLPPKVSWELHPNSPMQCPMTYVGWKSL